MRDRNRYFQCLSLSQLGLLYCKRAIHQNHLSRYGEICELLPHTWNEQYQGVNLGLGDNKIYNSNYYSGIAEWCLEGLMFPGDVQLQRWSKEGAA